MLPNVFDSMFSAPEFQSHNLRDFSGDPDLSQDSLQSTPNDQYEPAVDVAIDLRLSLYMNAQLKFLHDWTHQESPR